MLPLQILFVVVYISCAWFARSKNKKRATKTEMKNYRSKLISVIIFYYNLMLQSWIFSFFSSLIKTYKEICILDYSVISTFLQLLTGFMQEVP